MLRVLDPSSQARLSQARDLLSTLRDALTEFGAAAEDRAALAASMRQLDELFLVVIVGEFNAGKSAFINALLDSRCCRGRHADHGPDSRREIRRRLRARDRCERPHGRTAPSNCCAHMHIVDTPGTNAIIREHERLTTDFVPRSDLVLFVTSADRPFSETERLFLTAIRDWGKKIVIVLNKIDIFSHASELDQVLTFVGQAARDLLGVEPDVLPVSARLAQLAKHGDPSLWAASRFEFFERYLRDALDGQNQFRVKLANPLGVGLALANRFATIVGERLVLMNEDLQLLADIERQLAVYREDMERGFELRMSAVENVLADMEARGHRFFEDTLRIGRVVTC